MKKLFPVFFLFTIICLSAVAQDTLPKFSLVNAGNNRIIIGWVNKLENVKQISIQRSFDSLSGYKSILTVPDPTTEQNGYLDAKAINDHMFYRLYIMLDQGRYLFTAAKKPKTDSAHRTNITATKLSNVNGDKSHGDSSAGVAPVVIKLNGFPGTDSVQSPTQVQLKTRTPAFVPSIYVYTCRDGYVCIRLPESEKPKKYSIKFFELDDSFLFELKDIKEKEFKLDKANFYHAGWFQFELYEDGKLLEKHKFYLEKEF